jgi:hypothetical protein
MADLPAILPREDFGLAGYGGWYAAWQVFAEKNHPLL